jgi:hypothetical protein
MILAVKSRARRARKIAQSQPDAKHAIFRNQLYKLYTIQDLNKTKVHTKSKWLKKTDVGKFVLQTKTFKRPLKNNYLSYVQRASEIMEADYPRKYITNQIRKHRVIFNQAIKKHIKKYNVP